MRSVQIGDDPRFDLVDEPGPDRRLDHARVLAAGCAGEEVIFNRTPIGGGSDDPEIERLLQGDAETETALRREVRLFIAGNYPVVLRVAAALKRDGRLTGDAVEVLVRGRQRPGRRRP